MNTTDLARFIETLPDDAPDAAFGDALVKLAFIRELERSLTKSLKARLLDRVLTDGPRVINGVRWYAGNPPHYEIVDPAALVEAMVMAAASDWQKVAGCFASGWFKITALRDLLGDELATHVIETREPKLLDGKPTKQLIGVDLDRIGGGR